MDNESIGVGVAYTYHFGFLELALSKLYDENVKKMEELSKDSPLKHAVKKLLIIIPKSLICPPRLTGHLKQDALSTTVYYDSAGRANREYTLPIYQLKIPREGSEEIEIFYFIEDMPACLNNVRKAYHDDTIPELTSANLDEVRDKFCETVVAHLSRNESKYAGRWELLIWPDAEENNLAKFLHQQILSKRLTEPRPMQETPGTYTNAGELSISCTPMYRPYPKYPLVHKPRGYCVIINNYIFPKNSTCKLGDRMHSFDESEHLKELFESLDFQVERDIDAHTDVYENLTSGQMTNLMTKYQTRNHDDFDAFVCCILSHGNLGCVAAADGVMVKIIDLLEPFYETNCPSLSGKPKLFFIGACQTTEDLAPENLRDDLTTEAGPDVVTHANLIPSSSDFVVSYATLPNNPAWAHRERGGFYVKALCKCLKKNLEIDFSLKEVRIEVSKCLERYDKVQQPFHISTGSKLLFLSENK